MYIKVLTVTELNGYVKKIMDNDFILSNISVKGEVSNLKFHSSGHIYFSLKDEYCKINAIMFKSDAEKIDFKLEDGMNVEIQGRVSAYTKEGAYQLYCTKIKQEGIGDLYVAFNKLKEKLGKAGLFSEDHKKSIPRFPEKIAVITSPTGAAIRDIINVATRRNKNMDILIYPSLVQGKDAPYSIVKGIQFLNTLKDVEIIILARGGGSIEELWAFNDEEVAYAIYNSKKPIITGIGHEIDFTIADFVSDRRAPTPSSAAEISVPLQDDLLKMVFEKQDKLKRLYEGIISEKKNNVDKHRRLLEINDPSNYIVNAYNYIDNLKTRMKNNMKTNIKLREEKLAKLNALLSAHNPLNILNKGYSVIQDDQNNIISSKSELIKQKSVLITLKDGRVMMDVEFKGE
ncbi:exodeoxyribonuclease VII large subunit [Clostridium sp. 19966]|uniref:exodeoxyribonuclease VII large subunit n=1 Tax=Clostridium sp. 19966 TaxID=2768166 RepID=UPI0028DF1EFA|nr:exodeoxyribonuclease VII large subunit [Clostridium sp. 19966]MDT8716578.1 exodeoxyribonuclease VII large subunit [Clostridium sp. 19966]